MSIIGNALIVGINPKKMLPEFSYSGNYELKHQKLSNGDYNWELAILSGSNTNLKFTKVVDKIDVFLVGGGANGSSGDSYGQSIYGGSGGKGGQCITKTSISITKNTNYPLTIGGAGSNGSYAFDSSTSLFQSGRRYGAGGGAGGVYRVSNNDNSFSFGSSSGGLTGGGTGGAASTNDVNGGNASANTGSGGGGGNARIIKNTYGAGAGGSGGSGIIIIRNHR